MNKENTFDEALKASRLPILSERVNAQLSYDIINIMLDSTSKLDTIKTINNRLRREKDFTDAVLLALPQLTEFSRDYAIMINKYLDEAMKIAPRPEPKPEPKPERTTLTIPELDLTAYSESVQNAVKNAIKLRGQLANELYKELSSDTTASLDERQALLDDLIRDFDTNMNKVILQQQEALALMDEDNPDFLLQSQFSETGKTTMQQLRTTGINIITKVNRSFNLDLAAVTLDKLSDQVKEATTKFERDIQQFLRDAPLSKLETINQKLPNIKGNVRKTLIEKFGYVSKDKQPVDTLVQVYKDTINKLKAL